MLEEEDWTARRTAHEARVDVYLEPHRARRAAGVRHPVFDFLFTYYSCRPAQLRRWHPGFGVALAGAAAAECAAWPAYTKVVRPTGRQVATTGEGRLVTVSEEYAAGQRPLLGATHALLVATAARPPHLGCFGLHEWAMVYRLEESRTRHPDHPLRLGPAGTDAVVESHRVACSHFDAFRFFTEPARRLNTLQPGAEDRSVHEQPGCLHAGMDLYKHAFRLAPLVGSDLVADCFELAWEIRVLDMRASPYDLGTLGLAPVAIETPAGRQEYVAAQRGFAARGATLRARLIRAVGSLLVGQPFTNPCSTHAAVQPRGVTWTFIRRRHQPQ